MRSWPHLVSRFLFSRVAADRLRESSNRAVRPMWATVVARGVKPFQRRCPGGCRCKCAPAMCRSCCAGDPNGVDIADGLEVTEVNGFGILLTQDAFRSLKLVNVKPLLVQRGNTDLLRLSRTPGVSVALIADARSWCCKPRPRLLVTRSPFRPLLPRQQRPRPGPMVNYDGIVDPHAGRVDSSAQIEAVAFRVRQLDCASLVEPYRGRQQQSVWRGECDSAGAAPSVSIRSCSATSVDRRAAALVTASPRRAMFGPAVRFGGLQFGTEDTLDPRL